MKIGIDLDEVITHQFEQLVKFYHEKTGKLIPEEQFHSYYWSDVWGTSLEEAIAIDKDFKNSVLFDKIRPIENAIESMKKTCEE